MFRNVVLIPTVVITLCGVAAAHPGHSHKQPQAVILNAENWDDFVPHGKEVDAIYGDAVLANSRITAVIANPVPTRNANMTVRDVGGQLIDLTDNGSSSDQLSCFYVGKRAYRFSGLSHRVQFQQTTVNGKETASGWAEVVTKAAGAAGKPSVEVRYRLGHNDRFLSITTVYTNTGEKPLTVPLEDDIRADGGKEKMAKSPNGNHMLYTIQDEYWGQAYGIEVVDGTIDSESNSRTSTLDYKIKGKTEVTLAPGKSFQLERRVFPAANLLDVRARVAAIYEQRLASAEFTVRGAGKRPIPHALVTIEADGETYGRAKTDKAGKLQARLPLGDCKVSVQALGVDVLTDLPLHIGAGNNRFELDTPKWTPGEVIAEITDGNGRPIACKIEFTGQEGTPTPYFGPETATFAVGNLRYAPHGKCTQSLPSGTYDVIVSHGPEYDAIFTTLTVKSGETTKLGGQLKRVVNTKGWISADYHSHSTPSGDNTGSQLGRVLNLVCEHIEFGPCTEHNRVETYVPEMRQLGIEDRMTTVSGMELTGSPLPLNHQNVFPMVYKPRTQDGGGPVTDGDPSTQIERIFLWDDRSNKLIQQNHPDIGWLFYDKNGDGTPDAGYERSHGLIDVMEIHPVQLILKQVPALDYYGRPYANRMFAWMQLLNQGYRIPGVVNTDAHYNFHGSGGLRNWIQSSTDDAGAISVDEMITASEEGRLIMSNGPYLEFTVRETGKKNTVVSGQDLAARSGKVTVHMRAQCPNWLDIDRAFLLVNGRPHKEHDYRRSTHPELFSDGVVKFDRTLELTLPSDAHIIAVVGGENHKLGKVMGPSWGDHEPAALSNPVFVDTDGNGFTPNKDTLGHPLPVKFGVK